MDEVAQKGEAQITTDSPRTPVPASKPHQAGTILIVEHDPEIRGLLRFSLEQQGYSVVEAATGQEGIAAAVRTRPNAVVLDLALPDTDGLRVLQRLREWSRCHIVVLSQRDDEPLKLSALDFGANDFLARPFSMAELAARLRAAQRFAVTAAPAIFQSGELSVDLDSRTVKVSGRKISLTATEYSLLELFVRNAGKVLTHAQILREIWGPKMLKRMEYLRVYLKFLREKLEANPTEPRLFLTERSVGYRLAMPEQ